MNEKKIEYNRIKIEILEKKANIMYKLIMLLIIGYFAMYFSKIDKIIEITEEQKKEYNRITEKKLDIVQKAILLDKDKKYLQNNLDFMNKINEDRKDFIKTSNILKNDLIKYKNIYTNILVALMSIFLAYLLNIIIDIRKLEKEILNLTTKLISNYYSIKKKKDYIKIKNKSK